MMVTMPIMMVMMQSGSLSPSLWMKMQQGRLSPGRLSSSMLNSPAMRMMVVMGLRSQKPKPKPKRTLLI